MVLHELAERVRFRYGVDLPAADEAQGVAERTGSLWRHRGLLLEQRSGALDSTTERSIKDDLLDLVIMYSELRARTGFSHDALRILDEAEASCGPSARLEAARRRDYAPTDWVASTRHIRRFGFASRWRPARRSATSIAGAPPRRLAEPVRPRAITAGLSHSTPISLPRS